MTDQLGADTPAVDSKPVKAKKVAATKNPAATIFETDGRLLIPFLPADLVGGSVPYIPGHEDEAVWNAASQACGTERVYYCYTIEDKRCWYLAAPAASFSSHPDSWCPLAAALPGNSEFWDKETVYVYEQEGAAGAIRWDKDPAVCKYILVQPVQFCRACRQWKQILSV